MTKKNNSNYWSFIELIPTFFTVGFAVYVVLLSQTKSIESTKLLEWIITILGLLSTTILIDRFTRLRRIEKHTEETYNFLKDKEGKPSLDDLLINRKQLPPLEQRLKSVKEVMISGGSLFRLTNEYLGLFEEKAKEGCKFKFLLLNPSSEAAKLVATHIVYEIDSYQTYVNYINTALNNLDGLKKKYPTQVEIKIVDFIPSFSLFITDPTKEDGVARVELYTQAVPTRERPQIVLINTREPHWYNFFLSQFNDMWNSSHAQGFS